MTSFERSRHAAFLAATGLLLLTSAGPARAQDAAPTADSDTAGHAYPGCPATLDGPAGAPGVGWADTLAALDSLGIASSAGAPGVDSLVALGDRAFRRGRHTTAYAAFAAAVRSADGVDYEARWKAARAAVDVGQDLGEDASGDWYELAEAHARRAIEIAPERPDGHLHLGLTLGLVALDANPRERVRYSNEIRSSVRTALAADSSNAGAWHLLGRWNAEVMRLSGPARFFARTFLGGEVMSEASWEDAARYVARAAELEPGRIVHHLELGKVHRETDSPERARRALRRALELPPWDYHDCVYQREARELLEEIEGGG